MTRYQILLLPLLAGAILVLGGALKHRSAGEQPPLAPPGLESDAQALALLERAADAFAPERVQWLEAEVWQQSRGEGFTSQSRGRLLVAPGERLRFDMNLRTGKTLGELRLVCDGKTLSQTLRVAGELTQAENWELPVASAKLQTPVDVAKARRALIADKGFAGISPLMRTLRQRGQNVQIQSQCWKGRDVHVVVANWPVDADALAAVQEMMRPAMPPRLCCVYLDAATGWPHRIEWWGWKKLGQPWVLLLETEYRDVVLNQPLSPQRCAAEFLVP